MTERTPIPDLTLNVDESPSGGDFEPAGSDYGGGDPVQDRGPSTQAMRRALEEERKKRQEEQRRRKGLETALGMLSGPGGPAPTGGMGAPALDENAQNGGDFGGGDALPGDTIKELARGQGGSGPPAMNLVPNAPAGTSDRGLDEIMAMAGNPSADSAGGAVPSPIENIARGLNADGSDPREDQFVPSRDDMAAFDDGGGMSALDEIAQNGPGQFDSAYDAQRHTHDMPALKEIARGGVDFGDGRTVSEDGGGNDAVAAIARGEPPSLSLNRGETPTSGGESDLIKKIAAGVGPPDLSLASDESVYGGDFGGGATPQQGGGNAVRDIAMGGDIQDIVNEPWGADMLRQIAEQGGTVEGGGAPEVPEIESAAANLSAPSMEDVPTRPDMPQDEAMQRLGFGMAAAAGEPGSTMASAFGHGGLRMEQAQDRYAELAQQAAQANNQAAMEHYTAKLQQARQLDAMRKAQATMQMQAQENAAEREQAAQQASADDRRQALAQAMGAEADAQSRALTEASTESAIGAQNLKSLSTLQEIARGGRGLADAPADVREAAWLADATGQSMADALQDVVGDGGGGDAFNPHEFFRDRYQHYLDNGYMPDKAAERARTDMETASRGGGSGPPSNIPEPPDNPPHIKDKDRSTVGWTRNDNGNMGLFVPDDEGGKVLTPEQVQNLRLSFGAG